MNFMEYSNLFKRLTVFLHSDYVKKKFKDDGVYEVKVLNNDTKKYENIIIHCKITKVSFYNSYDLKAIERDDLTITEYCGM